MTANSSATGTAAQSKGRDSVQGVKNSRLSTELESVDHQPNVQAVQAALHT